MVEKLYISYQQMEEDCKNLAERVSKLEPKITKIVAITRGGMYPALMLAQYLNIKNIDTICLKSYADDNKRGQIEVISDTFNEKWDDPRVLFIDDLFDSGNTIAYIGKKFKKALKATIYYKNKSNRRNLSWLSFFQVIVPDTWLVFPFEKDPISLEIQEIIEEPKEVEKAEETIQFFQPEDIEKEFLGGIFLGKTKYKSELEELEIVAKPTFTDIPYNEPKQVIDDYDDDDDYDDSGDYDDSDDYDCDDYDDSDDCDDSEDYARAVDENEEDGTVYQLKYQPTKLDIELKYDELILEEGDSFCVRVYDDSGKNVTVKESSDTLKVRSTKKLSKTRKVHISYPEDVKLQELEIEMGAGTVYLNRDIETEKLSVEMGAGEFESKNPVTAREADLEIGTGSMTFADLSARKTDGECGLGELDLTLTGTQENYNYDLECGV